MDDNYLWTSPPKQKQTQHSFRKAEGEKYLFTELIHPSLFLSFRWKQRPPPQKKNT